MHVGSHPTPSTTGMWNPLQNQYDGRRDRMLPFYKALLITSPLLLPGQTVNHREEDSRTTYTNTPPVNTRKSPSVIQRSLVLPARRWGTLGSAPGRRLRRWRCRGSRAATGSTFLQIHKLTAMRNVSASLPLKTQPFVFSYLRKIAINNQTMQTATPQEQAASRDLLLFPSESGARLPLFLFPFPLQCQPATQQSVDWQAGSAWNNSKWKLIHKSLEWVSNLYIHPIPAWQIVLLQQDSFIYLSVVTPDLYDCERRISLQGLMKQQYWFFSLLSSQHTNVLLNHSFDSLQVPIILSLMVRQLTQDEICRFIYLF